MQNKPISICMFKFFLYNVLLISCSFENLKAQEALIFAEKYYLHTDRENYIAGEEIQFKAYSLIGKKSSVFTLSKVLYINMVNEDGISLQQAKFYLDNKGAIGSIMIPKDAPSGYYALYAYTKWQRNFGSEAFTVKKVFVVNFQEGIKYTTNETQKAKIQLYLIPEGGILTSGTKKSVVFYCKNEFGEIIPSKGKIVDSKDLTITNFMSGEDGICIIDLINNESEGCKIIVDYNNQLSSFDLPKKQATVGYDLTVDDSKINYINIKLIKTGQSSGQVDSSKLEAEFNGLTYMTLADPIVKMELSFSIPKDKFIPGLNNILLKNSNNDIILVKPLPVYDYGTIHFNIKADKSVYSKRTKVNINITSYLEQNFQKSASISVSVKRLEDQEQSFNNIVTNKYLNSRITSELGALPYTPENLQQNSYIYSQFDKSITKDFEGINYIPESEGDYISGTILDKNTGKAIQKRISLLVTTFDSLRTTKIINTDDGGKFLMLFDQSTEFKEVLFQFHEADDSEKYKIQIENNFETSFPKFKTKIPGFLGSKENYLKRLMLNYQLAKQFADDAKDIKSEKGLNRLFYGKQDSSYYLKKYIDLPSMEEVFNNLIRNVNVIKRKQGYEITIFDRYKQVLRSPALILIDGIPITDLDKMMKIPLSKIEKIELINSNYLIGDVIFGGIISIFSKENDFAGIEFPKSNYILDYQVIINKKASYGKQPETISDKHYPDFRNTLYWNPNLKTDKDGNAEFSFYTSNETGKFVIQVEGITDDGIPGTGQGVFEVKK